MAIPMRNGNYNDISLSSSGHRYEEIDYSQTQSHTQTDSGSSPGTNHDDGNYTRKQDQLLSLRRRYVGYMVVLGVTSLVVLIGLLSGLVWSLVTRCDTGTMPDNSNITSTNIPPTVGPTTPVTSDCHPQCIPARGCTKPDDPSACRACSHGRAQVGIVNLCVETCESLDGTNAGSEGVPGESSQFVCPDKQLVNVGRLGAGTTCMVSSISNERYGGCENVLDGTDSQWSSAVDASGEWIQLNFSREFVVIGLELDGAPEIYSQCKTYDLSFDGSIRDRIKWPCVNRRQVVEYYFLPVKTHNVRIRCREECQHGGAQGFRNIGVYTAQDM